MSVLRLGKISDEISVKIDTIDGSANEGEDYVGIHDVFTFAPGQAELEITVEIVDDDDWEPDEEFFLKIAQNPECDNKVKIGMRHIMTIMILNDVTDGVHVDMEGLDSQHDTILSSGSAELVLAQSELEL